MDTPTSDIDNIVRKAFQFYHNSELYLLYRIEQYSNFGEYEINDFNKIKLLFKKDIKDITKIDIKNCIDNLSDNSKLKIIKSIMSKDNVTGAFGLPGKVGLYCNLFDMYGNEITDTYVQTNTYPKDLDPIKKEILQFYNSQISV